MGINQIIISLIKDRILSINQENKILKKYGLNEDISNNKDRKLIRTVMEEYKKNVIKLFESD